MRDLCGAVITQDQDAARRWGKNEHWSTVVQPMQAANGEILLESSDFCYTHTKIPDIQQGVHCDKQLTTTREGLLAVLCPPRDGGGHHRTLS